MLATAAHDRAIVIVAAVALDLGSAEANGDATHTDVRLARRVANDGILAVMANLGGDLAGGNETGASAASAAADNLAVGSHLGGSLLGGGPGVFVLGSLGPDGRLLLAQEGDVAGGRLAHGADGAARG